jgi:hypothetical protein
MSRPRNRSYKRTWKNLLLNKRYQLRFTLFMVGLSAILMSLLGWWVMTVAARATTLAVNNTGTACQGLPGARPAAAAEPAPAESAPAEPGSEGARPRRRPVVTIDDSGMQEPDAAAPAPPRPEQSAYDRCMAGLPAKVEKLEDRQRLIFWVLVGAGVVLALGLLLYGIKMTHRVAGPLYKITLYLAKLRGGVYDTVYNLRKGDHLVDFYNQFKAAHAGMRGLQQDDVARLRALLAAAEKAHAADRSPELAAAITELTAMLARKEKSLV